MSDESTFISQRDKSLQEALRRYTLARVALGPTGPSIRTSDQLRFQLDHAYARDAVHASFNAQAIADQLEQRGIQNILLRSAVIAEFTAEPTDETRQLYLRRPDLGRTLHSQSTQSLEQFAASLEPRPDIVFIIADGLSALAVERHAMPLLDATLVSLAKQYVIAPVCVVHQARVAIGDEIGALLHAKLSITMIGERPGLTSPDSLGVYITWQPQPGRLDAQRNCISNIRQEGLSYAEAAQRIAFYVAMANRLQTTGTSLKEDSCLNLPVAKFK